jgi:hypothetical protein
VQAPAPSSANPAEHTHADAAVEAVAVVEVFARPPVHASHVLALDTAAL